MKALYDYINNRSRSVKIVLIIIIISIFGILFGYYYIHNQYDIKFLTEISYYGVPSKLFPTHLGYKMSKIMSQTYGEIRYIGMEILYNIAKEYNLTHTFIDLGCGVGKSLLMARLVGFVDVVGVEIVEGRYKIAVDLMKNIPSKLTNRINVYKGDSTTFIPPLTLIKPYFVFISNIMWSDSENKVLFNHLLKAYPLGTIIASSAIPEQPIRTSTRNLVTKNKTVHVPMSWYQYSRCYISVVGVVK